jgi:hypothetical protein
MTDAEIKHLKQWLEKAEHDFESPTPDETDNFYQIALQVKALVLNEIVIPSLP